MGRSDSRQVFTGKRARASVGVGWSLFFAVKIKWQIMCFSTKKKRYKKTDIQKWMYNFKKRNYFREI